MLDPVVYPVPTLMRNLLVYKMAYAATAYTPFGFLIQKVKTGYHRAHPVGFYMPGDLGSSDAIAQPSYSSAGAITGTKAVPVGVAHMGIWDTVHYTCANFFCWCKYCNY